MTAYVVITRERTIDADALARYRERAPIAREKHTVTPIAFYGLHEVLEGDDIEGVAILSFPTMAEAHAWYSSPEYQAALPTAFRAASLVSFWSRASMSRAKRQAKARARANQEKSAT